MSASRKHCTVAYATRERQHVWSVELPVEASVGDALRAAQQLAILEGVSEKIPWDTAAVGIFGELCTRSGAAREGDRIEIYRPLAADPRERRRTKSRRPPR
jgi:putative ubiquitin-RnfH superfamily antitoxin RatB of RatAB toxin-antitoxin module